MSQMVCKGCGQPLYGSYLTALGAAWHPEHFVCVGCGRPIAEAQFYTHNGAPYHPECYTHLVAPRCAYCGKPLTGEYMVDYWGTKFHKEHQQEYPRCAFCGRLVPPQQQERGPRRDRETRCPVCRATAIETESDARPYYNAVKQWVSGQGLRYNNLPLSLELVDRPRLAQLLSVRAEPHALGATISTTYHQNGRALRTEVSGVAVLQGLPAPLFQGVTAHELGHVWLTVHGVEHLPPWAEEGFCEYLSYRFYTDANTSESRAYAERTIKNPDPVYGEGMRRIKALVDKTGFQEFLRTLETTRRLPV